MRYGNTLFVLLVFYLFSLTSHAAAEDLYFSSQDELINYLTVNESTEIQFQTNDGLYEFLSSGGFRELNRILVKAGIDYRGAGIAYSERNKIIKISFIEYANLPWTECDTEEDVRRAFSEYTPDQDGFILLCSDKLSEQLINSDLLNQIAAQTGIWDFYDVYSKSDGIHKISSIEFIDGPYTVVSDNARFTAAIAGYAEQKTDDFYIIFEPKFFNRIANSEIEKIILTGSSKLDTYWSREYSSKCAIHYSSVEFTDNPRGICFSTEDVVETFRRMGTLKIKDFELIFPEKDLYDRLSENRFDLLYRLEAQAGMSSGDISYSLKGDRIVFTNAEINSEIAPSATLEEAIQSAEQQLKAGSSDIHLFCTNELFHLLLDRLTELFYHGKGMERIYDLVTLLGISDYNLTFFEATHVITIHINRLFPGTNILKAVQSGNTGSLSEREVLTMDTAIKIADEARNDDPLLTAKYIHDWICERTVYTDDESTDEDDNAIGVILNGEANCDGYTDAFYLIGSLAGLNIRYQHGDSLEKDPINVFSSVSHVWNLLEIGGKWRMVDVTWDDEEDGWTYIWFSAGQDRAGRIHTWNQDMTVPLAPDTDRIFSSGKDFYVSNEAEMTEAVNTAERNQLSSFYLLFIDPALYAPYDKAIQMVQNKTTGSVLYYSKNEKLGRIGFSDLTW